MSKEELDVEFVDAIEGPHIENEFESTILKEEVSIEKDMDAAIRAKEDGNEYVSYLVIAFSILA